ncbi:MBL fold metallo-hydrolase [Chloroflexota bacterium]
MLEIIPGIFQLKVPIPDNPLGYTNSYLVRGDGDYTIIDPGMSRDVSFEALQKEMAEVGVDFTDITRIIATHAHGDHYGLSGKVKKLSKARIYTHHVVQDMISMMSKNRQDFGRQMEEWLGLNGFPAPDESEPHKKIPSGRRHRFPRPAVPDVLLQDGDTVTIGNFSFKVIWTPGHDAGHICLYEPARKVLFSGDHVLPVTTPHVSMQNRENHNPLGDFLNSLNSIKDLEADLVLPGHEETFTDLRARALGLIQHHHQRDSRILKILKAKPKTAYQISTRIIWMPTRGGVKFQNLGKWHQRMAVSETLAHLKVMEIEGRASVFSRNGVVFYRGTV